MVLKISDIASLLNQSGAMLRTLERMDLKIYICIFMLGVRLLETENNLKGNKE